MKKTFLLLLAFTFLLSFVSCDKSEPPADDTQVITPTVEQAQTTEQTEPTTPESETQQAETEGVSEPITEPVTNEVTEPTVEDVTAPPMDVVYDDHGYTPQGLMYHLIMEEPYNQLEALFVRPDDFEAHLAAMNEQGYTYLFANDYRKTEGPSVIITFDDGYEDNYTTMFPILKKYNARATIFLISDMIDQPGYLSTQQIKEMADSGYIFFGCHTAGHCDLSKQTPERVRDEFVTSIAAIEAITGQECDALAYPGGGQNATVNEIASEYFKYAYLARPTIPDGVQTDMKIPRHYVARGLSASQLLNRIS